MAAPSAGSELHLRALLQQLSPLERYWSDFLQVLKTMAAIPTMPAAGACVRKPFVARTTSRPARCIVRCEIPCSIKFESLVRVALASVEGPMELPGVMPWNWRRGTCTDQQRPSWWQGSGKRSNLHQNSCC